MARDTLTGSRIRERRSIAGFRQADLARKVGISASYLNLIEHNRRRIGGKLLVNIADVLGVEPSMLSEGAEAALIATLREAAADAGPVAAETDRAEEFAGRFPGWAEVLAAAHRRIASLERTVETLSDRLAHDPHLAASLHEVLSTAAAIRSTASILAEPGDIEPEWRDRFHRNLNEDSLRLADSSKSLVRYLDETEDGDDRRVAPIEEVEALVAARGYHFPELEAGAEVEAVVDAASELSSWAARHIARGVLSRYATDARSMPATEMTAALAQLGLDPMGLAQRFGVDLQAVFRRLAAMPPAVVGCEVGLVVCDAAGSLLFRKAIRGFPLPRFGAPCPLWPVFAALSRPTVPNLRRVMQQGRDGAEFDCLSLAHPVAPPDFSRDPLYQATMLITPAGSVQSTPDLAPEPVGSTCRVCPRAGCRARREPSILKEGF
ncbi:MAG: short-chain fatty acyl-CoA regulator family protein [Pseudomonadota bacterium]